MSVAQLSSRAIIGAFFARLENPDGMGWINQVANYFTSDQPLESYKWLNDVPVLREWIGGRQAKGFQVNGIDIANKHFEATIEFLVRDMRRDKTGQVMARIQEFADRANSHWASLLSTLIANGPSSVCYDGQYFFDTDHAEGDSGTQSNDITVDISGVPVQDHGSVTAPSVGEMQAAILAGVTQIYKFVDSRGEPLNETAREFTVMTPVSLYDKAAAACVNPFTNRGESNTIANIRDFRVTAVANPRLDIAGWTDHFPVFRADAAIKSFIRQEETAVDLKVKAEGSDYEFDNDAHQYGIDTWRNVGYGRWQGACLVTMT